jgi:hypothetical protein
MRLTTEQSEQLLGRHGIWITSACDQCGNLLGAVRWTRRGEGGEWCSELCRDGVKAERMRRRGGRPRLNLSAKGRESRRRKQVRDAVERHRLSVIKNCPRAAGTEGLTDAILSSGYTPSRTAVAPLLELLR